MDPMKTMEAPVEESEETIRLGENVSLVIFDMDGVIANTAEGHKSAWREYLAQFNLSFTEEQFRTIFGTGNKELCPILFPDRNLSDEDMERIGVEKEALFREKAQGQLTTYDGFEDFLDLCDEKGVKMAVGSSASRLNVEFVLKELGIRDRFITIVTADDVEWAKPEPDIFLKAAADSNSVVDESLVIEDSHMGIEAAGRAGIRVAGLTTTHGPEKLLDADLITSDFVELTQQISD